jgi:hypothetical protein
MKKGVLYFTCIIATCFCSCKKSTCSYYTTSINLINADNSRSLKYHSTTNSFNTDNITVTDSKAYGIKVELNETILNPISNKDYQESVWYKRQYDLIDMNIKTVNAFDTLHPANSDVTDYFLTGYGAAYTIGYFIENKTLNERQSYSGYRESFTSSFYIMLMQAPTHKGDHAFEIKLKFEDGTVFTDTTNIKLL